MPPCACQAAAAPAAVQPGRSALRGAAAAAPRPATTRTRLVAPARRRATTPPAGAKKGGAPDRDDVSYGRSWFEQTRDPLRGRTVAQEIERRRKANWEANGGRDREDLYTDAWAGSEWRGSGNNVLTWILVASVAAPVAGLVFAYCTYGKLWG